MRLFEGYDKKFIVNNIYFLCAISSLLIVLEGLEKLPSNMKLRPITGSGR